MSRQDQIGKHATSIYTDNGYTCIKYHATDVVKFNSEKIILNSNGWQTTTTKTRMNQTSNQFGLGFYVSQKDFEWFVHHNGAIYDYFDGIELLR